MSSVKSWTVTYLDGSTFTSDDGPPEAAPPDGVLVIMEYLADDARRLVQSGDYYFWLGSQWTTGSRTDLERWMRCYPDATFARVKFGIYGNDTDYQAVVEKVMARGD